MYALVSVVLLGAGLYLGDPYMPWCFVASGLFAIASAIDGLNFKFDVSEKKED